MTDSYRTPSDAVRCHTADQAQRDTSVCMARADEYAVATSRDGEIAKGAGKGAVGGIGAAAWFAPWPARLHPPN